MIRKMRWASNVLVGAATVHDDSFLILKRSERESFLPNVWGIPAGQVHRDEDPSSACLRELLEETGLNGQIMELIGYSTFVSKRGSVNLSNIQLNFLVHVEDRHVILNDVSHSESRWISLDDTENELIDSFTRKVMISARQRYKEMNPHRFTHR
jgi:8-oxo-dGTP diphosphatase